MGNLSTIPLKLIDKSRSKEERVMSECGKLNITISEVNSIIKIP